MRYISAIISEKIEDTKDTEDIRGRKSMKDRQYNG